MSNIIEFLKQKLLEEGFNPTNDIIIETLREAKSNNCVSEELMANSRHWDEYEYIVNIYDKYIAFTDCYMTGDYSSWDVGYEFDMESIYEVVPVKKMIQVTRYEPVDKD